MSISRPVDQSAIGRRFLEVPRTAVALAAITVALDFACVSQHIYDNIRSWLAMITIAFVMCLSGGDHKSLGLRASPVQGWTPWIYTSLKIGGAAAICIIVGLGTWCAMGRNLNIPVVHPSQIWSRFIHMCLVAPAIEETVYRFSACGLIAAVIGNRPTIALNGVLFGVLHVLYGNPSPENLVGGFLLAWSFLKSETILVPVILHSGGNALVLAGQIAGWSMLNGAG